MKIADDDNTDKIECDNFGKVIFPLLALNKLFNKKKLKLIKTIRIDT